MDLILHLTYSSHCLAHVTSSCIVSHIPSDKGSAVVVMDRQKYIDEAMRQLNDRTNYRILDSDPTDAFSRQIQQTLDDMHAHEVLTDKAYEFLSRTDCKLARFYHQPKLHKKSTPGRPIVSGNGSPTENISLSLLITSSNLLFHRLLPTSMTLLTFFASLKPSRTRSPVLPSLGLLMRLPYIPTFPMVKVFWHAVKR